MRPALAATHRDHDLEPVAVGEQRARMRALRHDLAVALDGDLLADEVQGGQERRDLDGSVEAVGGAVDRDLDHRVSIIRYSPSRTRPRRARERHQVHAHRTIAAVAARATSKDANRKTAIRNAVASSVERTRWIMPGIMPRVGRR